MRSAINNPFSPGSDTVPQVWAGRVEQLADWDNIVRPRRVGGLPERGRTILGEAGLGKSALVRRIANRAESCGDWTTPQLRMPAGADSLKVVATAALTLADRAGLPAQREKRIKDLLGRVRTVAIHGMSLTVERATGPEPYAALTALLVEIGIAAIKNDCAVLIHIDEVQNINSNNGNNNNELSHLLISLGDAITYERKVIAPGGVEFARVLPIALYLTGLPDFAEKAGASKGATFARRFATTTLSPLEDDDLAMSLLPFVTSGWEVADDQGGTERVWMTPEASQKIIKLCCGEPFLFQLAGERAWYAGTSNHITVSEVIDGWATVREEAVSHVERILDRLPGRERQFLEKMAGLEPEERTLTTIARAMGLDDAAQAGPLAQRLDTIRGIIRRGRPYVFRNRAVEAYLTSDWPHISV